MGVANSICVIQSDDHQRPVNRGGCFQRGGGFPDRDLSVLFCPFVLLGAFSGFSRFVWGFSPICLLLSEPIKSTYCHLQGRDPKGSTTQSDFPPKTGKPPGWKPAGLPSLNLNCWKGLQTASAIATPLTSYRWEMGPKLEMAGKVAGGHFGEGPKWPKKWLDRQKMGKFQVSSHCLAIFRPLYALPKKWTPAILPAISSFGPISHL